ADEVNVHLRNEVAHDRQVEGLRHAGDLEPLGDAADAHEIDHHDIDRARLQHVPERRDAPEVLAAGDRRRQGGGDAGEAGEIVGDRHVLEPAQIEALEPPTDVHRLFGAPTLIDVDHQRDVGPHGFADDAGALDL